jgi:purine-binding chemotaxis protein CheW
VIPIVDLSKKFLIENEGKADGARAVVVEIKGKRIGLAIDSVSQVVRIDSKDISPPPPIVKGISGRYIVGIGKVGEGFVIILDIDQIFTSEDVKSL